MTKDEMLEQKRRMDRVVNSTRRACKMMAQLNCNTTEEAEAILLQKINSSKGKELIQYAKDLATFKAAYMRHLESLKYTNTPETK